MSILPAYLSSFSSVMPFQRIAVERQELDRAEQSEKTETPDKTRKSLIIRSGDVVSDHGDVFSPSQANRSKQSAQSQQPKGDRTEELSEAERLQVSELKQRDAEVKAHEAAHLGAAGGLARGGASYEYQKGPDGQNYAVGGEVSIDSAPVEGNPNATITKSQQIRSAALAPANPSAQDHKVAAKASQMEAEARSELARIENEQDSAESQAISDSPVADNKDKSLHYRTSQYNVNIAVTKYSAQLQAMSLRNQHEFWVTA